MNKLRLGILGSGTGSNFRAILDAIDGGELNAEIGIVISDVEMAGILELARLRDLPAEFVPPGKYRTKMEPEAEEKVARLLKEGRIELVVLAGFMRMLKGPLLDAFPRRIINIHPSLLPAFPGIDSWKQALAAGARTTGCTVHYVDAGMDTGEILAQREVCIEPDDTPESLHARIQHAEHALYPEVIAGIARKRSASF